MWAAGVTSSRVARGRRSEEAVAGWLRSSGWARAERTPAGLPGADVRGTPGLSFEVKARTGLDLPGWLRQAGSAGRTGAGELPVLVVRSNGQGEATVGQWAAVLTLADLTRLLVAAGYLEVQGE